MKTIMKYLEKIMDAFDPYAVEQARLEDACIERWGYCPSRI